jgi:hypothetical protein
MALWTLYPIRLDQLTSIDLHTAAAAEADNPTLEAYSVIIAGQAQRAEVLYFGDRDIAGVAWGADAAWLEMVSSAEELPAEHERLALAIDRLTLGQERQEAMTQELVYYSLWFMLTLATIWDIRRTQRQMQASVERIEASAERIAQMTAEVLRRTPER